MKALMSLAFGFPFFPKGEDPHILARAMKTSETKFVFQLLTI
jgi:hypothetical protein